MSNVHAVKIYPVERGYMMTFTDTAGCSKSFAYKKDEYFRMIRKATDLMGIDLEEDDGTKLA